MAGSARPSSWTTPPLLDHPDLFDPARVLLTDLDGAGPHDLLYVGHDGIRGFVNEAGNRWGRVAELPAFPWAERVATVDLLGTGTPCLVWSSAWPAAAGATVRYVELMPAGKPHLLTGVRNNLGAETVLSYASSTLINLGWPSSWYAATPNRVCSRWPASCRRPRTVPGPGTSARFAVAAISTACASISRGSATTGGGGHADADPGSELGERPLLLDCDELCDRPVHRRLG